jgi:hypothetical protein
MKKSRSAEMHIGFSICKEAWCVHLKCSIWVRASYFISFFELKIHSANKLLYLCVIVITGLVSSARPRLNMINHDKENTLRH